MTKNWNVRPNKTNYRNLGTACPRAPSLGEGSSWKGEFLQVEARDSGGDFTSYRIEKGH